VKVSQYFHPDNAGGFTDSGERKVAPLFVTIRTFRKTLNEGCCEGSIGGVRD
jgi:hypothetical protein